LSWAGGFGALTEMEPTDAEKLKARRVQLFLYVLIALMIGIPVAIYFVKNQR
jgi:hypothetical protein